MGSAALTLNRVLPVHAWARQPVLLEAGEAVVLSRAGTFVLCSDPAVPPAGWLSLRDGDTTITAQPER